MDTFLSHIAAERRWCRFRLRHLVRAFYRSMKGKLVPGIPVPIVSWAKEFEPFELRFQAHSQTSPTPTADADPLDDDGDPIEDRPLYGVQWYIRSYRSVPRPDSLKRTYKSFSRDRWNSPTNMPRELMRALRLDPSMAERHDLIFTTIEKTVAYYDALQEALESHNAIIDRINAHAAATTAYDEEHMAKVIEFGQTTVWTRQERQFETFPRQHLLQEARMLNLNNGKRKAPAL